MLGKSSSSKSNNTERWVDVHGYEGLYKVSNYGKIIDLSTNQPVEIIPNLEDHAVVLLTKNCIKQAHLLGSLVASAFIPQKSDKSQTIYHKDGNVLNNRADNLGWIEDDAKELDHLDEVPSQYLIHYINQIFLNALKREPDRSYLLASENLFWSGLNLLERIGYIFDVTIDHQQLEKPTTYMTGDCGDDK